MLQTDIEVTGAGFAERRQQWIEDANVGGSALAAYQVREVCSAMETQSEARLTEYPRWSNGLRHLVGRGFHKLGADAGRGDDALEYAPAAREEGKF